MDVIPTRFLDSNFTNTYLSFLDVCHFRAGSDWFSMLRLNTPTYPQLSKEFLSTLQLHNDDEDCLDNFCIEFRMAGVKYKLSIAHLSEAYGLKHWQNRTKFDEFNVGDFWKRITTEDSFEITKSKASQIYFMLKHIQDFVIPYDSTFMLGGLLMPIANFCGVSLSRFKSVQGETKVDISYLFSLGMLSLRAEGGILIHFTDRAPLVLPNLDRIRLNAEQNWKLED